MFVSDYLLISKSNPLWTLCNILLTKLDLQCVDDWVTHYRDLAALVSENFYIGQSHFYKIVELFFRVPNFFEQFLIPLSVVSIHFILH